jgi:hypothetical protein
MVKITFENIDIKKHYSEIASEHLLEDSVTKG